jgi:hypothetical protein
MEVEVNLKVLLGVLEKGRFQGLQFNKQASRMELLNFSGSCLLSPRALGDSRSQIPELCPSFWPATLFSKSVDKIAVELMRCVSQ